MRRVSPLATSNDTHVRRPGSCEPVTQERTSRLRPLSQLFIYRPCKNSEESYDAAKTDARAPRWEFGRLTQTIRKRWRIVQLLTHLRGHGAFTSRSRCVSYLHDATTKEALGLEPQKLLAGIGEADEGHPLLLDTPLEIDKRDGEDENTINFSINRA